MIKKMQKIIEKKCYILLGISILITCLTVIFVMFLSNNNTIVYKNSELVEKVIDAEYVSGYDDTLKVLEENSDFVFKGIVEKNLGTEYTDKETFFDSNNEERTVYNIFTKYKISITENIKNDVGKNSVTVEKLGGISKEYSYVNVLENDDLLEEGTEYIFSVSRCDDVYKACGENTSIEITASNESKIRELVSCCED